MEESASHHVNQCFLLFCALAQAKNWFWIVVWLEIERFLWKNWFFEKLICQHFWSKPETLERPPDIWRLIWKLRNTSENVIKCCLGIPFKWLFNFSKNLQKVQIFQKWPKSTRRVTLEDEDGGECFAPTLATSMVAMGAASFHLNFEVSKSIFKCPVAFPKFLG